MVKIRQKMGYFFESSVAEANASHIEAEVRRRFSAARVRHPNARLFLRASVVCAQLQAVANALGADLIVTSRDYHRRFLRCLTCAEAGGFCICDCIDFTDRLRYLDMAFLRSGSRPPRSRRQRKPESRQRAVSTD
jgi:hypothetical protein